MNWGLRIFALFIDFLQFMVFVGFTALQMITPAGGAGVAGTAGATYCWYTSSNAVSGALNAAWCAVAGAAGGGLLSTFAIPLGMAVDFAISVVLGGALIIGIAAAGKFRMGVVLQSFIGETIPLINFLPIWSIMVHRCLSYDAESSGGLFSTALKFATNPASATLSTGTAVATATLLAENRYRQPFGGPAPAGAAAAPRAPALMTRVTDIKPPRAANDNAPAKPYAQAA